MLSDSSSSQYKQARRQYIRSTKNRPADVESDWSPFRRAEKRYKARYPPPDLSNVIDLASIDRARDEEVLSGRWRGSVPSEGLKLLTNSESGSPIYSVTHLPGLVLLPSFISPTEQKALVCWALVEQAKHPNITNLDAHYQVPDCGIWQASQSRDTMIEISTKAHSCTDYESDVGNVAKNKTHEAGPRQLISNVAASLSNFESIQAAPKPPPQASGSVKPTKAAMLLRKLRWVNIGWFYHWGIKQYDFSKGREDVSSHIQRICKSSVNLVPWQEVFGKHPLDDQWEDQTHHNYRLWGETYEPDAGIVNFYQTNDTLMAHVDHSEVCATSPLVSISLGNAAVFLIGGQTRDVEPTAILLRSGDVVIMAGPSCRRAYHGVPRILEDTLPPFLAADPNDLDWQPFANYMESTRININMRQVFPPGLHPKPEIRRHGDGEGDTD